MEELQNQEITASAQKAMELENEFDYDEYQVVRKELFAHERDPAIVIRSDSVSFNTACIKTFKGVVYIQLLISPELHRIAIKKCGKNDKDAIRWCIEKADGRKTRQMKCVPFATKVFKTMGWDTSKRYKIQGYKIVHDGEELFVFDLTEPEIFINGGRRKKTADGPAEDEPVKPVSRKPEFPEAWQGSFGMSVEEHINALNLDILNQMQQVDVRQKKEVKEPDVIIQ